MTDLYTDNTYKLHGKASFILFYFFKDFIYLFDRQRSQVGREAGRERGGSRLPAEQRA